MKNKRQKRRKPVATTSCLSDAVLAQMWIRGQAFGGVRAANRKGRA